MDPGSPSPALDRAACLLRLATAHRGRALLSVRSLPSAVPVRLRLVPEAEVRVVTSNSAVVALAERGQLLGVQTEGRDPDGRSWAVTVAGLAQGPVAAEASDAASPDDAVVIVPLTSVSGHFV